MLKKLYKYMHAIPCIIFIMKRKTSWKQAWHSKHAEANALSPPVPLILANKVRCS